MAAMVIMAGGKGMRLRPLTDNIPKPMVTVNGKPIISRIIKKAVSEGIFNFHISVNYKKEKLIDLLSDGKNLGANIAYLEEQYPMGTGGSLSLLQHAKKYRDFIITNGDILLEEKYASILLAHRASGADVTMVLREHSIQNPYGVVETKGSRVIGFTEKPVYSSMINTGIYALNSSVIASMPQEFCTLPDIIEGVMNAGMKVHFYEISGKWFDVGTISDLEQADLLYKNLEEK
jgi:NDP-sugar pyrophosphorylase family protein